jgi:hypothetical protein
LGESTSCSWLTTCPTLSVDLSYFFRLDFRGSTDSSDEDEALDALVQKFVGDSELGLSLVGDVSRDLTQASSDEALDVLAREVGDVEFRDL